MAGSDLEHRVLVRAASLRERRQDGGEAALPAGFRFVLEWAERGVARAEGELRRWRDRPPFDEARWWRARLEADGLDEPALLRLLAEPVESLARRLPAARWAEQAIADLWGKDSVDDDAGCDDLLFAPVAASLLASARGRIRDRLELLGREAWFDRDAIAGQLHRPLASLVDAMVCRTVVLEAHVARGRGELLAESPEGRFSEFMGWFQLASVRRAFFEQYPVLARKLTVTASNWVDASGRLIERLLDDRRAIADRFFGGVELGPVTEIVCGLGPRHRGGATMARIGWGERRLVYKPRSLAVDRHFQSLLSWFNDRGFGAPFRMLSLLDRGPYGWVEHVEAEACPERDRRRFHRRQGGILAALYLLHGTDMLAENVVAAGEHPIAVDLESLFHPRIPFGPPSLAAAERTAAEASRGSVLTVGLLPEREAPLELLSYADDVAGGFAEVYDLCVRYRDDLGAPGGPIEAFSDDEVRVLRQPTSWYASLLQTGFHPEALRDGLAQEQHLDALWRTVETSAGAAACIPAERADLWNNDIPIFTAKASGCELLDSGRRPVPGVSLVSGMAQVRARLDELGPIDLARQLWLIRGGLGTAAIAADRRAPAAIGRAAVGQVPAEVGARPEELIAAADRIGWHLRRLGFESGDSIQWLGLSSVRGVSWSLGPLAPDLVHGLSGLALFYAWLGELSGDPAHTEVARKALRTMRAQLGRRELAVEAGMAGIGGVVYALTSLSRAWDDWLLLAEAVALLDQVREAQARDTAYDFVSGSAGAIAALLALHRACPTDSIADSIQAAVGHLDARRIDSPEGVGWLSETARALGVADRPIAGFAQGVGGVAWSLFSAAALLGDERADMLARSALRYERARVQPGGKGWHERLPCGAPRSLDVGWCHGPVGIGLSRLLALPYVAEDPAIHLEIEAALEATRVQPMGLSHCLCHGDLGNIELFLQAARQLGERRWLDEALRRAERVRRHIAQVGWRCGTPLGVETPSLLVGLAGIGYGLLRCARPDRVPAVLAML